MALKGFTRNFSPLKILTEEQIEAIHRGTLAVLERTGLRIQHQKALKLLAENGCKVDYDEMRVRFPPGLVEECLRKCPSSFTIKARNPENDLILGADVLYMTTFPGLQTIDLDTWEPRIPTRKEYYDGVTVLDALDNLHFTSSYVPYFGFEGVPPVMSIPEGFAARIRNLTKVVRMGYQKDSEIFTINMAKAVGAEAIVGCMASPPLTYYPDAIESLYRGIEADFNVLIVSGGIMGGTAPATVAGSRLTDHAELIGGLVLGQLIKPGAKTWVQSFTFPQNMQSGIPAFGAIECALHNAIYSQYFGGLGIRTDTANVGSISSKRIDFQNGYEKAIMAVITALSGLNSMHLYGGIFGELAFHPVQAILDDDISGMIGRFLKGVEVNDETLAIDLINDVGPIPGMYLDKAHTRKWWKQEQFIPRACDRLSYPDWMEKGKKSALDYAKERMEEILTTHKPIPLTPTQEEEIERILKEAREYYRKKGLISDEEWVVYMKSLASPNYPYG